MSAYEVLVVAFKTVIVDAETEDEALDFVRDEVGAPFGWEVDEISIDSTPKTEEEIQHAMRHGAEDLRD